MRKREIKRAAERKFHYTYLIIDHINTKFYYGVHSTDYDPNDIQQYHSSSRHLNQMINHLGIENFSKHVRRYFKTRKDANLWEHKVLRRMKVRNRKDFYNQSEGGVGFSSEGFLSVRSLVDGTNLRVPVDDPYIDKLYEFVGKGRKMSDEEKKHLSDLYKGKWTGDENPVHYMKDDPDWIRKLSELSMGRKLSEEQKASLRDPDHWKHLLDCKPSDEARDRALFHKSVNNVKFKHVYFYKGEVYFHVPELPVTVKTKEVVIIEEPHPPVNILKAGDRYYPDVKSAAKSLGVVPNTMRNRLKSKHVYWEDYFYLSKETVIENKAIIMENFKEELKCKYKDLIMQQKSYVKPFSLGMTNKEATKIFMNTGRFLEGTTFERLNEKDTQGYYSWYKVTCPLCSYDEYVKEGVCDGIFKAMYGCLKIGGNPCRCGDSKNYKLDIYLHHVKKICENEGIEFIGVSEFIGKKETKIKWKCKEGNLHENTRLGLFLEKGARCRCCRSYYKENPPEKVNLKEIFKQRKELYLKEKSII